jgi:hypothetical protein
MDDPAASALHAPQGNVLYGLGARSVDGPVRGVHANVPDGCVGCHMAEPPAGLEDRVGEHTFAAADGAGRINRQPCTACHDDRSAGSGDALSASVIALGEVLEESRARWRRRLASLKIEGRCGGEAVARDVRLRDGAAVLIDDRGRALGDCDGDGRFGPDESPLTLAALPKQLGDSGWDLLRLLRDGSRGIHNPSLVRALQRAVESL